MIMIMKIIEFLFCVIMHDITYFSGIAVVNAELSFMLSFLSDCLIYEGKKSKLRYTINRSRLVWGRMNLARVLRKLWITENHVTIFSYQFQPRQLKKVTDAQFCYRVSHIV